MPRSRWVAPVFALLAACSSSGGAIVAPVTTSSNPAPAPTTPPSSGAPAASTTPSPSPPASSAPAPTAAVGGACRAYRGETRGTLPDAFTELSGWALSKRHTDVLWGHNDSGDGAVLIAVSTKDASLRARVTVTGATSTDWEDVATFADAQGRAWLAVADIGDNAARRDTVSLVLVPEPALSATTVAAAGTVTVRWADGPHDAEAIIADPLTGDVIVVGKRFSGARRVSIDRIPAASLTPGATVTSEQVGVFDVPDGEQYGPTSASIDAAGTTIGLGFYARTMVWARTPGRSVVDTLLGGEPCTVDTGTGQYESLAIADDGTLLVATEGRGVPLRAFVPAG